MSSIYVSKMLSTTNQFANRKWFYEFREIRHLFKEDICAKNATNLAQQFSKITKNWSKETNSEWICRIYFSAKMILHSTLQLMNLEFADEKNIRLVNSYLKYYALLSACRAVVITLPTIEWNSGKITEMTHQKIINVTFDYLCKFDSDIANKFKQLISLLKANRELITYRAPTNGDYHIDNDIDIIQFCTTLAELAQFNSEILEASIHKNAKEENFFFISEYKKQLSQIHIGDFYFYDHEDAYRLDYLKRKWSMPPNVLHIMTEGHTEDFFGSWEPDEYADELFTTGSPCDRQIIFDIP
jgi:hypothetical protein